jgi:hypothetical protein
LLYPDFTQEFASSALYKPGMDAAQAKAFVQA